MSLNIAYLAQGKLYLKQGNKAVQEVESEFGQSIQERRLQIERRQSLRNRGIQSMMRGPQPGKGNDPPAETAIPISITSICPDGQKQLLYALESADLGGLFTFDPANSRENRLFHNTEFRISHLDYSAKQDLIACTKTYQTGVTNLATLSPDKVRPKDLTEGDSIDIAPRWVTHKEKALVYQSAGVSRNQSGLVINRAPFSIMQIDFAKEDVTTLAEDPKSDLMGPQLSDDGWLYYIRRPYRSFGGVSVWQTLKDIVLMPVRLIYAVFQFFNIFTQTLTGKPLINAVTRQKVEQQQIRTLGGWFSPENLPKKHVGEADAPSLVPPTWQLVRQGGQGIPEVLAKSVLSYDLADDGSVVYTNGSGVYRMTPEGRRERILIGQMIDTVKLL